MTASMRPGNGGHGPAPSGAVADAAGPAPDVSHPGATDQDPAGPAPDASHPGATDPDETAPLSAVPPSTPGITDAAAADAPSAPGAGPGRGRTDGVAVAAMALGALALVPLALVAGIVSLARTRAGRRSGRVMAITGIVLAGVWTLAGAAVGAVFVTHRGPRVITHFQLPHGTVFSLHTGECADTAANGLNARVIPCAQPHSIEIYASYQLPGHRWPGSTVVASQARSGCASRLAGYLNPQFALGLTESYAYPGRHAWLAHERTVVCEIGNASGKMTGSLRGLGR